MRILIFLSVIFVMSSCIEKEGDNFPKKMDKHDRMLLDQAFSTGDRYTAAYAIQSLLTRDTANYGLMDTLTRLYMQLDDYNSALVFSRKLVRADSSNYDYWSYYAECTKKLGLTREAIKAYHMLFKEDDNSKYLYEIAIQKLNMNEIGEAQQLLASIFNDERARTDEYLYPLPDGRYFQMPVIAAAHFLMGTYVEDVQKNTEQAIIHYKAALEYAPGFFLASRRLEDLNNQ